MKLPPYEKLGAFYLGRIFDAEEDRVTDETYLYDSRDLTTHAVCVGMTGSGKTGLCVTLLEEAAIDGIPAIVLDPKGDLGNLLLTFPKLDAADFRPWVDASVAAREGESLDDHAASVAAQWRSGLAEWNQDGARIERLRHAAECAIYTPGSSAGLPLAVLSSFAAPPPGQRDDSDGFRERVSAAASSLLALVGIEADPIQSREHILLSSILKHRWQAGEDLDLEALIRAIQSPPFEKVGFLDLEAFFPAKDRFQLTMAVNNLVASPGFSAWLEGEPLQIERLLWTRDGRPRIAILSIAHLSDAERMFFVTLLLNELITWMRAQPGTGSLRALLYMDEVFGYLPPTANPPSKTPLLTLLKQARAYGVGVVLATQNPVDLDYKSLSNSGTWLIGRLQTERDQARVLDGLAGSGLALDRSRLEAMLARLEKRVFLVNNVHDEEPTLIHSRWAMSYLRGPLTRAQIETLMRDRRPGDTTHAPRTDSIRLERAPADTSSERPVLSTDVPERFLAMKGTLRQGERLVYRPVLLATARVHFVRRRPEIDVWNEITLHSALDEDSVDAPWEAAERPQASPELCAEVEDDATFAELPGAATRPKSYVAWARDLKSVLYRTERLPILTCSDPKATSEAGESETDFERRLRQLAREARDAKLAKLQKSYAPRLDRIRNKIRRAQERVARETGQYQDQKRQSTISVGATMLGALLGRRKLSVSTVRRATTAVRGLASVEREKGDIARAERVLMDEESKLTELEEEFQAELDEIRDSSVAGPFELDEISVKPRKTDIGVSNVCLAWAPWRVDPQGIAEPAFTS